MKKTCWVLLGLVAAGCGRSTPVAVAPAPAGPSVRLEGDAFVVTDGFVRPLLADKPPADADGWAPIFAVYVGSPPRNRERPPLLGEYRLQGDTLRFEPRFPPRPGTTYVAVYDPTKVFEASPNGPL